jgi:hypothetical protein
LNMKVTSLLLLSLAVYVAETACEVLS